MRFYKAFVGACSIFLNFISNGQQPGTGNKSPRIEIITDAAKVAELRSAVLAKLAAAQKATTSVKKSLAERYKSGDKSAVPEIIQLLKGNDQQQKAHLYFELGRRYDDPESYSISEKELVDQILTGIDNPAEEKDAVQLAGINNLPGYAEKMEARLLSGKSTDMGRIFFWLAKKGKQTAALDYVSQLIKENKLPLSELDQIISGLETFGENGDNKVRHVVGELALTIYNKHLLSKERFEELRGVAFTSDAAEILLICLFEYGDKRVVPIAQKILNDKLRIEGPVKALIRLEGPKHLDKVYTLLKDQDNFYKGLSIVEHLDKKYLDEEMLKEVLIQFSRQGSKADYVADRIVKDYMEWNAQQYITGIDQIVTDKKTIQLINRAYDLKKVSMDNVLQDLIQTGLITKSPSPETVTKIKSEAGNSPLSFAYGILEATNNYLLFDTETDSLPVDFDNLLNKFAATSQGVLKDMLVGMDATEADDAITYRLTIVYKDKAYIAHPEFLGDWYDLPTIDAILQLLLEQSGSAKRFVLIDTGDQTAQYIFGVPATVQAFVKKYQ